LGRTKACGRDHLSDMDSRWSLASHGVRRSPGGQAGGPGAARSRSTRLIGGSEQGSINQRRSGVDVKRSLQIAAGGAPANWRKRQVVVASYLRLDQWRDPVSRVYPNSVCPWSASATRLACEYRLRLTSGEYLWVEDNGLPIDLMLR
jgi:hypothetical protein